MLKTIRAGSIISVAAAALLLALLLACALGAVDIPLKMLWQMAGCAFSSGDDGCSSLAVYQQIVWQLRIPRLLLALLTGAGLAICGLVLQVMTRNPLADPYLFGISAGAALGAVVVNLFIPVVGTNIGAFVGAMLAIGLMITLAGYAAVLSVERLLLSGVAVSFMLSALTSLVLFYADPSAASSLLFWLMGSFSAAQWSHLPWPALVVALSFGCFFVYSRWLSAIFMGEESAMTLGIPVARLRLAMLGLCALVTAILVSYSGGIGFVGLMVPHIARYLVGVQMRFLLVLSALIGGAFMVLVDLLARTTLEHQVLPIGAVTSVVGSVFFFIVLKRRA